MLIKQTSYDKLKLNIENLEPSDTPMVSLFLATIHSGPIKLQGARSPEPPAGCRDNFARILCFSYMQGCASFINKCLLNVCTICKNVFATADIDISVFMGFQLKEYLVDFGMSLVK